MGKRKRSAVADAIVEASIPLPPPITVIPQISTRSRSSRNEDAPSMNAIQLPQKNGRITSRISKLEDSDSPLSDSFDVQSCEEKTIIERRKDEATETLKLAAIVEKDKIESLTGPEADSEEIADEEEIKEVLSRPPPVNSDYLPLPWKGRLGYVRYRRQHLNEQLLFG
jgi:UV DNA damage endonuclease